MEDDHQDFVADSHSSLPCPNTCLESPESVAEERVRLACCSGAFDKYSSELSVALVCLSLLSFTGIFLVAGTHACPGNKAGISNETVHVDADLRDDYTGRGFADT